MIGGYTYGGFEWGSRTFGLHGATVGGGWEREVAPGWTFKAEYRYTQFQDKDMPRSSSSSSNATNVNAGGGISTTVSNTNAAITDRVSGVGSHALRFGLTHYFGGSAPTMTANVAARPPQPAWTGLYGGVSFGLTSMHTSTASTFNDVFNATQTAPGIVIADVQTANAAFNTAGQHHGAVGDIFVGYSAALGANVIAGVQAEGSIAHATTLGNGSFVQVTTLTDVTDAARRCRRDGHGHRDQHRYHHVCGAQPLDGIGAGTAWLAGRPAPPGLRDRRLDIWGL